MSDIPALIEPMRRVLDAARLFRRAYLHAELAAAMEDKGERPKRSSASWYAEVERRQGELFGVLEALDGPMEYDV
jgi:hypothetical protein